MRTIRFHIRPEVEAKWVRLSPPPATAQVGALRGSLGPLAGESRGYLEQRVSFKNAILSVTGSCDGHVPGWLKDLGFVHVFFVLKVCV